MSAEGLTRPWLKSPRGLKATTSRSNNGGSNGDHYQFITHIANLIVLPTHKYPQSLEQHTINLLNNNGIMNINYASCICLKILRS